MFQDTIKKRIKSIQFGLFSPEEIRRGSVVQVIHPETIENGFPKSGGLIDLKMGTTERSFMCLTCEKDNFTCPGHFGHIELTKPMFHIGYISKIKKILDCICFYCSKIKLSRKILKPGLNNVWAACKTRSICEGDVVDGGMSGCGNKQPIIKKEGFSLVAFMKGDESSEGKVILNGEKVHNILKKICEEDLVLMGFDMTYSKPEWMLISVLLVPPPTVRPSIVMEGMLRAEDDLTHKLADIVKSNTYLKKYEMEGAPSHIIRDYEQLLQFHIATLMDNDISGQPQALQKGGRPLKSISARLKGKEGRVRGNLMGKRVDFSARSVITADPNISLVEVGVPYEIAKIHTFPEKVTPFNVQKLERLVDNGPNEYPGANYVIRTDGQRVDLKFNRGDIKLEEGYIVERHMQDGDVVLFNRQPSLHKMSMMGHYVKIMKGKTFRLNLSVTGPYNADFDGDEMNLHMPQSHISRAELEELCLVSKQILSPQSNKPVMGIVQDTLTGLRLFTMRNSFFNERETMFLLYSMDLNELLNIGNKNSVNKLNNIDHSFNRQSNRKNKYDILRFLDKPAISSPKKLWTGKQILSYILPDISYIGVSSEHADNDTENLFDTSVVIYNGDILSGIIDKKSAGSTQGGLIHIIYNDFGPERTTLFFNNVQKIINSFITYINAFTIGIGDTVADKETTKYVSDAIARSKKEVYDLIKRAYENSLDRLPGMSLKESFESQVNLILNKARDISGTSAQKNLNINNNIKTTVLAGSKGSFINISQVMACVGQQNVEGKRIPFGFSYRTLPHFCKEDYSGKSRGFVKNSYLSGLSPEEFYFHAMGGREGLIDTAIKTAETGYIQRRLVKAMEDATVKLDKSVRGSGGFIYQYNYGEDGFDATFLEMQRIEHKNFKELHYIDMFDDIKYAVPKNSVTRDVFELLSTDIDVQKRLYDEYEWLVQNIFERFDPNDESNNILRSYCKDNIASPVNFGRIINSAKMKFSCNKGGVSPYVIFDTLKNLSPNNLLLKILIFSNLSVKAVLVHHKLSLDAFLWIVDVIKQKFNSASISCNEMVGTLAAQSVGEPATQMTLNTFHLAGVSSTVTMGVPRLKEIINVAKNIKTPSMKVYLNHPNNISIESARVIQSKIEFTNIRSICLLAEIYFDPLIKDTYIQEDKEFVSSYFDFPDENIDFSNMPPLIIRLTIDRAKIISRNIKLDDVVDTIKENIGDKYHIIASDENSREFIIRIRAISYTENDLSLYSSQLRKVLDYKIKGLENIKKVFIAEDKERKEWFLQTDGVCLREILNFPSINGAYVTSNDLNEITEVLGIEAAREMILREIIMVIDANGSYVNNRHISLLADIMTMKGYLTGITRHGVNRVGYGTLKRASFEETVDILLDAAVNAENNLSKGITENIMLGQIAPLGTGDIDLLLDVQKLDKAIPITRPEHSHDEINTPMMHSPVSDSESVSFGNWSPVYLSDNIATISYGYSDDLSGYKPIVSNYVSGAAGFSPRSPSYSPASPSYSLTSPSYSPASPSYSPTSPSYSPASPSYSPTSPSYSPASPSYSPTSPSYSPTSPSYSPTSPSYSPTSPSYSPTSPSYSPTSPSYSPTSPSYSPTSPSYSPTSPSYSPTSPSYSPTSPSYSPTSPSYSPTSPSYSPTSPSYSPTSPSYSPTSQYSFSSYNSKKNGNNGHNSDRSNL